MPRRQPPKPIPDPPLPHGAEGPSGREEPEAKRKASRQYVKMPPASIGSRLSAGGGTESAARPTGSSSHFSTASGPQYELRSAAETAFPELFAPVDSGFWHGLSDEQRLTVTRMQAAAMERVGFETGTQKYFIDGDVDDTDLNTVLGRGPAVEDKVNELGGGGNWIGGGILIGAGLAALSLGLSPLLNPDAARLENLFVFGGALGIILGGVLAAIKKP